MVKQQDLIGTWKIDPTSSDAYGNVNMTFDEDGGLKYSVHENGKEQIMLLRYFVDGDFLVTDQPSSPRRERTKITIDGQKMTLDYEGKISSYTRVD